MTDKEKLIETFNEAGVNVHIRGNLLVAAGRTYSFNAEGEINMIFDLETEETFDDKRR